LIPVLGLRLVARDADKIMLSEIARIIGSPQRKRSVGDTGVSYFPAQK
jgi:hypothetical protein